MFIITIPDHINQLIKSYRRVLCDFVAFFAVKTSALATCPKELKPYRKERKGVAKSAKKSQRTQHTRQVETG